VSKQSALSSLLGRAQHSVLHNCTTIPVSQLSNHPSMRFPYVAWRLAIRVAAMDRGSSTPGYVKLLLPPRQSRGNSHFGLAAEYAGGARERVHDDGAYHHPLPARRPGILTPQALT
jgi:hypothetical protein